MEVTKQQTLFLQPRDVEQIPNTFNIARFVHNSACLQQRLNFWNGCSSSSQQTQWTFLEQSLKKSQYRHSESAGDGCWERAIWVIFSLQNYAEVWPESRNAHFLATAIFISRNHKRLSLLIMWLGFVCFGLGFCLFGGFGWLVAWVLFVVLVVVHACRFFWVLRSMGYLRTKFFHLFNVLQTSTLQTEFLPEH